MLALLAAILLVRPSAAVAQAGGAKTQAKPVLNVVVIGDFYSYGYAYSADPVLRGSVPPTLQALNQIQAANPGVQVNVLFIPVKDATRNWLPPVVNSVRDANIVIVGVGANDARLTESMRTVLFGTAASAKAFPQLMAVFDNGSFLQSQAAFLGDIAARAAPGSSIVTLGYPTVLPEQLPSGFTWWSPFSWTAISQQQANMSNQLVSALNTANDQATSMVAAHHPGLHFLYADLSGALQGKGPFSPQQGPQGATPANTQGSQSADLRQTLIGSDLLPYVDQAVNDVLSTKGVQGAQDIPSITPKSRWKLTVHEPVVVQVLPTHPKSNMNVNTQPQIDWNNQTSQPPWSSNLPANPAGTGGPAANGQQGSGQDRPSISLPFISLPFGDTGQRQRGDQGRHPPRPGDTGQPSGAPRPGDTGQPSGTPQPGDTGQPSGTPRPVDTGQPSGTPRPVDTGQPSVPAQPSASAQPLVPAQPSGAGVPSSPAQPLVPAQPSGVGLPSSAPPPIGLPAAPQPGGCPASMGIACQDCGISCSHAGGGGPTGVPVIPAPPAPLPPPITPHETPGAGATPGSGTTPATGTTQVAGAVPAAPAPAAPAPGTAPATGAAQAPAIPAPAAPAVAPATPPPAAPATAVAPATQALATQAPAIPAPVAPAPVAPAPAVAPVAPPPATPDAGITPNFAGGGA